MHVHLGPAGHHRPGRLPLSQAAKPVLLDEWQVLPDCLWAVKSLIDDEGAGGFIIAGSASPPPDDRRLGQFPLTGRAVVRELRAMCKAERADAAAVPVADLLLAEQPDWPDPERLSQRDYVGIAAESGYPACVGMDASEEDRYLQGVVGTALQHDVAAAGRQRGGERFRQAMLGFLRSFALHSGRITSLRAIADHARISDRAAAGYQAVFSACHLIEDVEVWRPSADSSGSPQCPFSGLRHPPDSPRLSSSGLRHPARRNSHHFRRIIH